MANEIEQIMTADKSGEVLVRYSEQLAVQLKDDGLSTSQIRNIFSEVRRIESKWRSEGEQEAAMRRLVLLKPKMAYQAARQKEVKRLVVNLDQAINFVEKANDPQEQEARFMKFVELFEAILAYHKAKGGKK